LFSEWGPTILLIGAGAGILAAFIVVTAALVLGFSKTVQGFRWTFDTLRDNCLCIRPQCLWIPRRRRADYTLNVEQRRGNRVEMGFHFGDQEQQEIPAVHAPAGRKVDPPSQVKLRQLKAQVRFHLFFCIFFFFFVMAITIFWYDISYF
jgi:hypothetical protein